MATDEPWLPLWVYDLIIEIDNYEDAHGTHEAGFTCFDREHNAIPHQQLDRARAMQYSRLHNTPTDRRERQRPVSRHDDGSD
jgi:hypothetical protein